MRYLFVDCHCCCSLTAIAAALRREPSVLGVGRRVLREISSQGPSPVATSSAEARKRRGSKVIEAAAAAVALRASLCDSGWRIQRSSRTCCSKRLTDTLVAELLKASSQAPKLACAVPVNNCFQFLSNSELLVKPCTTFGEHEFKTYF